IIDVTPGVIKYKKFENQGGHVFSIAREQVGRIAYENGQTTYFREEEPKREKITEESPPQRKRPSSTFGWHIGFGGSTINGEYINSTWQLASTIGASFNLNIGAQSTLLFGAEILSIGCGLKDENYFDFRDSSYYEFSNWNQDMGYIGLEVMFRQYFNHGRNYFFDIGLYGSFLINATWQGDVVITDTAGNVTEGPFNEDLTDFYQPLDYGLAGGVGGRIPLGESKKWHITLEARFYYGLQNIFDYKSLNLLESRESNIYGILLVGVDLPTNSSD
ncbi:MAG TPA: porin family protein, partial [Bacteroidales bacterium]|nr:porin family protein [Bacteroidales bacterium]